MNLVLKDYYDFIDEYALFQRDQPQMNIRYTSIRAYRKLKEQGIINAQEFEIVTYLLHTGNKAMTRREIEEGTGMRSGSVCGRVRLLLDKKVLAESLKRKCKISGERVNTVYVKLDNQIGMF